LIASPLARRTPVTCGTGQHFDRRLPLHGGAQGALEARSAGSHKERNRGRGDIDERRRYRPLADLGERLRRFLLQHAAGQGQELVGLPDLPDPASAPGLETGVGVRRRPIGVALDQNDGMTPPRRKQRRPQPRRPRPNHDQARHGKPLRLDRAAG
jgi:hypothetical protein